MSLATRCPACHTVFRVVQDQLRVSEGWVRCGQCQEVFNALETLFDLGPLGVVDGENASTPAHAMDVADTEAAARLDDAADKLATPAGSMSLDELAEAPVAEPVPRPRAAAAEAAAAAAPGDAEPVVGSIAAAAADVPHEAIVAPLVEPEQDDAEAPTPSRFMGPAPDWARQPARERRSKKSKSKPAAPGDTHAQAHQSQGAHRRRRKPEFVRQAERAALWRRPMMRALLGSTALLLGAMLVLQMGYQYREPLAAQVPALAPGLRKACAWVGCRIGAPRAIERIRLDASDLTRTDEEQVLRLTADVHNTADYAVRTPALDVSFTDALGRTVSRKVLLPTDLGARGESIDADAQWRVDARLAVGEQRIAGYTVEIFYP